MIDDLPLNLGGVGAPLLLLQELRGDAIQTVVRIDLADATGSPLRGRTDGLPVLSAERWLRVLAPAPAPLPSGVTCHAENLSVGDGWELLAGVSTETRTPGAGVSAYARDALPTAPPGLELNVHTIADVGWVSDWVVLQAIYAGLPGAAKTLQSSDLRLAFHPVLD